MYTLERGLGSEALILCPGSSLEILKVCFRFLGLGLKAIPALAISAEFMIFGLWFLVLDI
jgi:hypothetical protein